MPIQCFFDPLGKFFQKGDHNLLSEEFILESELSLHFPVILWLLTSLEDFTSWAIIINPVLAVEELNVETIESRVLFLVSSLPDSGGSLFQDELVNFIEVVLWEIKGEPEIVLLLVCGVVETAGGCQVNVVVSSGFVTPS